MHDTWVAAFGKDEIGLYLMVQEYTDKLLNLHRYVYEYNFGQFTLINFNYISMTRDTFRGGRLRSPGGGQGGCRTTRPRSGRECRSRYRHPRPGAAPRPYLVRTRVIRVTPRRHSVTRVCLQGGCACARLPPT